MENESLNLKEWLNLTNQQYLILKAISMLQKNENSKPKDIEQKYSEVSGKAIQKTNLFGILKFLSDKHYIFKDEKMNYRLNLHILREHLEVQRELIKSKEEELTSYMASSQGLLSALDNRDDIVVTLIDKEEFYNKISTKLRFANEYYNISRFPSVFFTKKLSIGINRDKYIEVMEKECFTNKRLKLHYLTNLDISRVYKYALSIFKDKGTAKKETKLVIQRFKSLIKSNDNLFIYYSEDKPDWEFIIPRINYPRELFLILRSKDREYSPGILHIISSDVSEKAFIIMSDGIKNAERVTKTNIKKYIKKLRIDINNID